MGLMHRPGDIPEAIMIAGVLLIGLGGAILAPRRTLRLLGRWLG